MLHQVLLLLTLSIVPSLYPSASAGAAASATAQPAASSAAIDQKSAAADVKTSAASQAPKRENFADLVRESFRQYQPAIFNERIWEMSCAELDNYQVRLKKSLQDLLSSWPQLQDRKAQIVFATQVAAHYHFINGLEVKRSYDQATRTVDYRIQFGVTRGYLRPDLIRLRSFMVRYSTQAAQLIAQSLPLPVQQDVRKIVALNPVARVLGTSHFDVLYPVLFQAQIGAQCAFPQELLSLITDHLGNDHFFCPLWELTSFMKLGSSKRLTISCCVNDIAGLSGIEGIGGITELDLSNNALSAIDPGELSHLPRLQRLMLSNNQLTEFSAEIFRYCYQMMDLFLDGNKIASFSEDFYQTLARCSPKDRDHSYLLNVIDNPLTEAALDRLRAWAADAFWCHLYWGQRIEQDPGVYDRWLKGITEKAKEHHD